MMTNYRPATRRPSLCLALTLTLICTVTLPHEGQAFFFDYGRQQQQQQQQLQQQRTKAELDELKGRVSELETLLQESMVRLRVAEQVVTDLGRQECAAGEAILHKCSENQICVTSPEMGTLLLHNQDFDVQFNTPFLVAPVLQLSSDSLQGPPVTGGNCSQLELKHISRQGLTLTLPPSPPPCPLPMRTRWYACPAALFQADQGLPLPVDPDSQTPGRPQAEAEAKAEAELPAGNVVLPVDKGPQPLPPTPAPTLAQVAAAFLEGWGGNGRWDSEEEDK